MSASSSRVSKPTLLRYPGTQNAYRILEEIGGVAHATVHRAIREVNSTLVAIKIIDLDQYSEADSDAIRGETRAMILHSHPNVLGSHCSFEVDHYLLLVMPYMAGGSLQSMVSSSFRDGLLEPCISIALKETLKGLSYFHRLGYIHTDIQAGKILLDRTDNEVRSIKLEGSVMSVSIYNSRSIEKYPSLSSSSRMRLTDVAGTPYWMAPEVIQDSNTGYSFKSDIWSFGVTALELAHGGPPFYHLALSNSLMLKIKKRFGFDYDKKREKVIKNKPFSQEFKDMVACCLDQDPSRRPSADQLLEYSFFKNSKGKINFFSYVFLCDLANVEERFEEPKALHDGTSSQITAGTGTDSVGSNVKVRRISGWKFNESELELEPEFYAESKDDAVMKTVGFGGETIIDTDTNIESLDDIEGLVGDHTGANMSGTEGTVETSNPDTLGFKNLAKLKETFDRERRQVESTMVLFPREADGNAQMVQEIENLMEELILEKEKNFKLMMVMENINVGSSGASIDSAASLQWC